jgi:tetratricopeptide (TPR) repeat protein
LPGGQLSLLTGCFAAVVALLVHGLVDSDLYYFGIGTVFFLLMGAALNLAGDAVAPELVQRPVRILAAVACCGISGLLLLFSLNDIQKGIVRRDIATRDSQSLKEDAEGLGWATSFDGEARYLQAMTAPRDRIGKELQDAYEMLPTERVARMLANVLSSGGKFAQAEDVLRGALERDPNNMLTLSLLAKIQAQKGDQGAAVATAKKLVATESTPYFKVRSIPESVPTWTYDARLDFLAPAATDQAEKAKLLAEAVKGYLEYAKVTVPIIKRNATSQDQIPGFDTEEEAKFKLQKAIDGGETAIQIYRKVGGGDPAELEGEVKDLLAALAAA